jgi:hypothetical protein
VDQAGNDALVSLTKGQSSQQPCCIGKDILPCCIGKQPCCSGHSLRWSLWRTMMSAVVWTRVAMLHW